ncbi:MAG TPA: hypothetical protein HPP94_09160 [Desulfuromonadales bacterium]|nr:hypothetical protein [Desulfuromonadales bacterium]
MRCPKCKAQIGVMNHEIIVETGIVECIRCIICGYYEPRIIQNVMHQRALDLRGATTLHMARC